MNLPPCPRCAGTGQGPPPGAELRRLREESTGKPSIGSYARALDVSTSFLSEIERGKKPAPQRVVSHYYAEDWFADYAETAGMEILPGQHSHDPTRRHVSFVAQAGSTDFGWGETESDAHDDAVRRYKEHRPAPGEIRAAGEALEDFAEELRTQLAEAATAREQLVDVWEHWLAEGYAAGWMDNLSEQLKDLARSGGGEFGMVTLGREQARKILRLVTLAGAWPSFDEKTGLTVVVADYGGILTPGLKWVLARIPGWLQERHEAFQ